MSLFYPISLTNTSSKKFIKGLEQRPVIVALTATAPPEYHPTICRLLGIEKPEIYTHTLAHNKIILLKENCPKLADDYGIKKRLSRVKYYIKKYGKDGRIVIYCATRSHVDIVSNYLTKQFPGEVVKCHAYMDSDRREKHELQYINGHKRIMVATTAFGMGIDVPYIRLVLHFTFPLSTIDYYQQIGRAGRKEKGREKKAHAMLLYHPDDVGVNQYIIENKNQPESVKEWLHDRLYEMVSLIESDRCLMQQLLESLGEGHPNKCRHCTNCQKARR